MSKYNLFFMYKVNISNEELKFKVNDLLVKYVNIAIENNNYDIEHNYTNNIIENKKFIKLVKSLITKNNNNNLSLIYRAWLLYYTECQVYKNNIYLLDDFDIKVFNSNIKLNKGLYFTETDKFINYNNKHNLLVDQQLLNRVIGFLSFNDHLIIIRLVKEE